MTLHPQVIALIRKLNESGFSTEKFVRDTNKQSVFLLDFLGFDLWSYPDKQKLRDLVDELNDGEFISEITVMGFYGSEDEGDQRINAHLAIYVSETIESMTEEILQFKN